MEHYLQGIGVSPGIAMAPALLFFQDRYDIPVYKITDIETEMTRFDAAIAATRGDLEHIYQRTVEGVGQLHGEIFKAHLLILDDATLREDIQSHLHEHGRNVEHSLDNLAKRYVQVMESLNDPRFRERTADVLDVIDRILRHLLDAERPDLKRLERESIIVSHDLSPSDTASMDMERAVGLIVEAGSVTSHSAILARAIEIPAVVGVVNATTAITTGSVVIIDGSSGRVIINPTPETCARYDKARKVQEKRQARLLRDTAAGPACTVDKVEVALCANIELPIEIAHSLKVNAQGIGLYRTEYLFLNRDTLPTEEEQYEAYAEVARASMPHPVTLRTIDIGGDKFVAHLQVFKEANPQLGWRAVRFCLARPDIFKTQLRAMLRASVHGSVRVMFPMISGVKELRDVLAIVREVRDALDDQGVAYDRDIKFGSMIEVPSAVALADMLATECDFFSIGTNDLIQYLLAVDRVNERIAHLYEPAHPAVIRMLHTTVLAARDHKIPCSVCGEMASDPIYTELLLGLGIRALSMASVAIPLIRKEIAHINMKEAGVIASQVLGLRTSTEVLDLLSTRQHARAKQFDYHVETTANHGHTKREKSD